MAASQCVHMSKFEESLGRVMHALGALDYERPFLAPCLSILAMHVLQGFLRQLPWPQKSLGGIERGSASFSRRIMAPESKTLRSAPTPIVLKLITSQRLRFSTTVVSRSVTVLSRLSERPWVRLGRSEKLASLGTQRTVPTPHVSARLPKATCFRRAVANGSSRRPSTARGFHDFERDLATPVQACRNPADLVQRKPCVRFGSQDSMFLQRPRSLVSRISTQAFAPHPFKQTPWPCSLASVATMVEHQPRVQLLTTSARAL